MALEAICLQEQPTTRSIQDSVLAMSCRLSVLIDSVRAAAKSLFAGQSDVETAHRTVDQTVDSIAQEVDKLDPLLEHEVWFEVLRRRQRNE